jgi:aspartyl protease family protein
MQMRTLTCVLAGWLLPAVVWAAALEPAQVKYLRAYSGGATFEVKGTPRYLLPGQASPEGLALVSVSATEAVVRIGEEQYGYAPGSASPRKLKQEVVLKPDGRGHYPAQLLINGRPVGAVVDTGATDVSLHSAQARQLGIAWGDPRTRRQASTANGVITYYEITLKSVKLGDIELNDVKAGVQEAPLPVVLLGMSFLSRLKMEKTDKDLVLRK